MMIKMNTEILELLQQNNHSKNWESVKEKLKPLIVKKVNGKPVYQFFDTLKDRSLQKNGQLISISTQPVKSFIPYHIHNYVEMIVVLQGECIVRTPTEKILMKQDEIIMIGNQTIHKVDEIAEGTIVVNIALKKAAFSLNELDFLASGHNTQSVSSLIFSLLSSTDSHGHLICSILTMNHI